MNKKKTGWKGTLFLMFVVIPSLVIVLFYLIDVYAEDIVNNYNNVVSAEEQSIRDKFEDYHSIDKISKDVYKVITDETEFYIETEDKEIKAIYIANVIE